MVDKNEEQIKKEILSFPGKIHLICTNEGLKKAEEDLKSSTVLGFDTETRPSFKKGQVYKVALLQLSTETDAYLIRLHKISKFNVLVDIFEDEKIIKTGVAIRDDIKALQKLFEFKPENFKELQTIAKEKGLTKFGLKGMAELVLNGTVTKGPKMTNWAAESLTKKQLMYAATDAWIGLKLFKSFESLKKS